MPPGRRHYGEHRLSPVGLHFRCHPRYSRCSKRRLTRMLLKICDGRGLIESSCVWKCSFNRAIFGPQAPAFRQRVMCASQRVWQTPVRSCGSGNWVISPGEFPLQGQGADSLFSQSLQSERGCWFCFWGREGFWCLGGNGDVKREILVERFMRTRGSADGEGVQMSGGKSGQPVPGRASPHLER